ncbi:hypothetical protein ACWEOP_32730, partial [Streptomyces chartreusis]
TLAETGVDPNTRVRDLSEEQLVAIREYVDNNTRTPASALNGPCPQTPDGLKDAPRRREVSPDALQSLVLGGVVVLARGHALSSIPSRVLRRGPRRGG